MKDSKGKAKTNGKPKKKFYGTKQLLNSMSARKKALKDASAKAPTKRKKSPTKKA